MDIEKVADKVIEVLDISFVSAKINFELVKFDPDFHNEDYQESNGKPYYSLKVNTDERAIAIEKLTQLQKALPNCNIAVVGSESSKVKLSITGKE